MTSREVSQEEESGKIALFISSVTVGIIGGFLIGSSHYFSLISCILLGSLCALINPFVARSAVWISERCHCLAFPDTYK